MSVFAKTFPSLFGVAAAPAAAQHTRVGKKFHTHITLRHPPRRSAADELVYIILLYAFLIIGHEHNYSLSFLAIILKLARPFFGRMADVVVGAVVPGGGWFPTHSPCLLAIERRGGKVLSVVCVYRPTDRECLCEDEIFDFSPDENTLDLSRHPPCEDFQFLPFPGGCFKKNRPCVHVHQIPGIVLFQYFYVT